ncbi:hypothetical protein [uncultured Tateyamaria sp.]|uniref:hypothetical protein n=1 Tax=uncultured Tateyamaria sp. TaxID=455651 RepID=UPI002620DCE6|nr:hypothetical protein [uncultured Tateyamaria sp.]
MALRSGVARVYENVEDPLLRSQLITELEIDVATEIHNQSLDFGDRLAKLQGKVPKVAEIQLARPPGSGAVFVLEFLFPKNAFEVVFSQHILDMREEYYEALSEDRPRKARWIIIRDHFRLILTIHSYLGASVAKSLLSFWKMKR